jgi:hypothetical protein
MQRHLRPGQLIRVGASQGEVLELTTTGIVLATSEGRMMLPGSVFSEESVSLLTPDRDDE